VNRRGNRIGVSDEDSEKQHEADLKSDILKGVRVLAVDDQADTRELIILALTRYGAEVRACKSANKASEMIREWTPDVIVSDIGMPDEDGYDLMRKIRALTPGRRRENSCCCSDRLRWRRGRVESLCCGLPGTYYKASLASRVGCNCCQAGRAKDLTRTAACKSNP
jgi:hypothetical protein